MFDQIRNAAITFLGILLCLFTLAEVNYPRLQTQSALAVFVMLGLVICFLVYPLHPKLKDNKPLRCVDVLLALATVVCCGYVIVQTEPFFNDLPSWFPVPASLLTDPTILADAAQRSIWANGQSLASRAALETNTDYLIGLTGLFLVLEATRRSIGWIVPALALTFVFHSYYCYLSNLNEVQTLTLSGDPTDGSFTVAFEDASSPPIKPDASADDLKAALEDTETIGFGNVRVEGTEGGPWTVEFRDEWRGMKLDLLTTDAQNLTGGSEPNCVVEETVEGATLPLMPEWLLPHAGQSAKDIASTTFLQTLGVFGQAAGVMFKYVFLFVVFGAFLEMSGATQFIIDFAERIFGRSPGGPAKISVLGSGLMGSLSGSAVANAVTTGAFTIPMMRNAGSEPKTAGVITAAAAAGGALVPPVMGAGAYMMLELVKPEVTFLQIAKAALIPAALYYLSIFMIVHFYSRRIGMSAQDADDKERRPIWEFEALVFGGALTALVGLLLLRFTPFKAVSGSLVVILALSTIRKKLNLGTLPRVLAIAAFVGATLIHQFVFAEIVDQPSGRQVFESWLSSSIVGMFGLLIFGLVHPVWRPAMLAAMTKSAKNGISLVAASACVGIIIGIVQQTGIATDFSAEIKGLVETNLFLALIGIMCCSIVLGMGVPSVVCYLLMATLMGSLLSELGVLPLAAHLFIFYFGMMSMVTPPVALAAYASASIANARIMPTALAAFRFSLVGFTLPFMFVYRPELLLMSDKPDIEVRLSKPKEIKTDQPAAVSGNLKWAGEPVGEAKIDFVPTSGSLSALDVETDVFGEFTAEFSPGDYSISVTRAEGEIEHMGRLVFDPTQSAKAIGSDGKEKIDLRLQFIDQRLSIPAVIMAVLVAVLGIIALAAGIAGFMFSELKIGIRTGMIVAAALLLSPNLEIGGNEIGLYANLAGGVLFVVTAAISSLRARTKPVVDN